MTAWLRLGIYILCYVSHVSKSVASDLTNDVSRSSFPENFIFCVAAPQIEIARSRNVNGRGESIWDWLTPSYPMAISSGTNAQFTFDNHRKHKDDIMSIKDIGFGLYKLSLPWASILPNGSTRLVNTEALRYYQSLLNELQANGIHAMVILHQGDLPTPVNDIGGWLNPLAIKYFVDYARLVFQNLGPKVKWWITINEPSEVARSYGSMERASALHGYGEYKAGHNLLLAHASVYSMYKDEFAPKQRGKVSISLKGDSIFPASDSEDDHRAVETAMQFTVGWFGHPVLSVAGNYPPLMRDYIDRNSAIEGLKQSRLPYFNKTEVQKIRGSFDFIAVNHETSSAVTHSKIGLTPSWRRDSGVKLFQKDEWTSYAYSGAKIVPEGIRHVLNYLKDEYGELQVFVTENGNVEGQERISCIKEYLSHLIKAIKEDGCNVIGYCVKDLDLSESGYSLRKNDGLHKVNFTQTSLPEMKKISEMFWKRFLVPNSNLAK